MIIGQQVQTQLIYIQPLRIELSASIPSSSFCFFKVLPLEKRVLAWAVRCIGFVVNMTSGRTIGAETEEKYPYLNRDGVGMPAGREASGPLEASLWDGLNQARFVV
jgi:hypothetical protein